MKARPPAPENAEIVLASEVVEGPGEIVQGRWIEHVEATRVVEHDMGHHAARPPLAPDLDLVRRCRHVVSLRGSFVFRGFRLLEPPNETSQEPTPRANPKAPIPVPDINLSAYSVFVPPDPFEDHMGPIYYKLTGDARHAGSVHCVLPTHAAHGNYSGGVHGGALLTFADYALCLVAGRAAAGGTNTSFALTVSIAAEFLDTARIGPPLEARGEPLQVTGRLAFARGSITQEGRKIALWSGVCRHVARAKAMARKVENAPKHLEPIDQQVPPGFELFATASAYSRHIGPIYVRPETDGTSVM